MLTRLKLGSQSLVGVSVGGIYTSLCVPELDSIFDIGVAPRSFAGPGHLFISHAHADHVGALPALLGVRGLSRQPAPKTFLPVESRQELKDGVEAFSRGQKRPLDVPFIGMSPGDEQPLYADLVARAFRTRHSVPSLGYELFRRIEKLLPEHASLSGEEIRKRRAAGERLFRVEERSELAYATDTLIDALDENPRLFSSRILILECTFLDERKDKAEARRKCHVHLDEILERADSFQNEHLVLMHFSQFYQPKEVHHIMKSRLPERLAHRVRIFAPREGTWPG